MIRVLGAVDKVIEKVSTYALVFSVFAMLFLSITVIVCRWFSVTYHWIEPFVRHLVFLSAFLGGVIATGRGTHIGIDIIGKFLESQKNWKAHRVIQRVIALASFLTLLWLVKSSYDFYVIELEYGKPVFWGISSGYLVGIIPLGFCLIGYRFFYLFIQSFFITLDEYIAKKHEEER